MISADEADVIAFFEVKPARLDPNIDWPYNSFTFEVARGALSLYFSIEPAYKDLTLRLSAAGATVYELTALGVDDVRYNNDNGRETLEIKLTEKESLWLRVNPAISIIHSVTQ